LQTTAAEAFALKAMMPSRAKTPVPKYFMGFFSFIGSLQNHRLPLCFISERWPSQINLAWSNDNSVGFIVRPTLVVLLFWKQVISQTLRYLARLAKHDRASVLQKTRKPGLTPSWIAGLLKTQ
jgi:hypothetical protein